MAAQKHLPNLRQGDDYSVVFNYPAGTNITNFKFYLTLKKSFTDLDSQAVLQHFQVAGNNPLDNVENGVLVFTVPSSVTSALPTGAYFYDFQAIDAHGGVETLFPPLDDYRHKLSVVGQVTLAVS